MERLPLQTGQPSPISAVNSAIGKGALPYVKHNAIPPRMAQGVGVGFVVISGYMARRPGLVTESILPCKIQVSGVADNPASPPTVTG